MDFLHQIKVSFHFYWRAYRFIESNNLWRMLIIPAAINLIITFVIIIFAIKTSGFIVAYFFENFQFTTDDPTFQSFVEGLLMVLIRALVFFLYLKLYRYLILICMAPSFAVISAKVHALDAGVSKTPCTSKYLLDCTRGIRIAILNFALEISISTFVIAVSFLIAWIIPIVPLLILLLESYFVGYSLADYRNEYYEMSSRDSRKLINSYLGLTCGNGFFFNLFLLIPVFGVIFTPTVALIASGLSLNHLEKRKSILCNSDQSTLTMAKP